MHVVLINALIVPFQLRKECVYYSAAECQPRTHSGALLVQLIFRYCTLQENIMGSGLFYSK